MIHDACVCCPVRYDTVHHFLVRKDASVEILWHRYHVCVLSSASLSWMPLSVGLQVVRGQGCCDVGGSKRQITASNCYQGALSCTCGLRTAVLLLLSQLRALLAVHRTALQCGASGATPVAKWPWA